jgi:cell division protein ZapA
MGAEMTLSTLLPNPRSWEDSLSNANGNGSGNVRVEIYDQTYHLRGSDPEYIAELAEYVDTKMRLIAKQASTVDSLRVAVLTALNIADEFHVLKRKYDSVATDYNERAEQLAGALDEVLADERRAG